MSDATQPTPPDANNTTNEVLPKSGRVTEVCQEWMVREDGALAYRLQNQEISEHYSGNKYRNAVVREDFPRAKTEQIREQQLAEQAAAVYHRMLAEQEEIDNQVAKELAEQLAHEERSKRRVLEVHDQDVARQLLERERLKVERHRHQAMMQQQSAGSYSPPPPPRPTLPPRLSTSDNSSYQSLTPDSAFNYHQVRRQAKPMALPSSQQQQHIIDDLQHHHQYAADLYTEPYRKSSPDDCELSNELNRIEIAVDDLVTHDDEQLLLTERQLQEEKDAELARQLQEQEGSLENTLLNRDRLLAIEAQDKELAKLLQERERNKAKRAREKARQRSLAKKQQLQQHQQQIDVNQLMPDDSYSFPADLIPSRGARLNSHDPFADVYAVPGQNEDDVINYSLPADVLLATGHVPNTTSITGNNSKSINYNNGSQQKLYAPDGKIINGVTDDNVTSANLLLLPSYESENVPPAAVRPTQLDLRSPLNRLSKPRFPDPEVSDKNSERATGSPSSQQHINIAMAIDPTYPRRGVYSSSSYDTSSSTVTTSTSSSSPGNLLLPSPDIVVQPENDDDDDNNGVAPPYMPIQGQRRTASLEKKQKKKGKDGGCKQQ